jgi:hypothetical protein
MCDDMKEHCEGVNGKCVAMIDVVCLAVVRVEENLNMFAGCLYSVGMGSSPSRTRLKFGADCNSDIASTRTKFCLE